VPKHPLSFEPTAKVSEELRRVIVTARSYLERVAVSFPPQSVLLVGMDGDRLTVTVCPGEGFLRCMPDPEVRESVAATLASMDSDEFVLFAVAGDDYWFAATLQPRFNAQGGQA